MQRFAVSRLSFYILFTVSGFAGLIYESVWTQYLKLFLGHAAYAQSLVLVVFMGGMAAGAAWCARRSARFANPLAVYAAVEAVIGLASLVFHPIFAAVTDWSYAWLLPSLGQEWLALGAKLLVSCALILPQSVLLGMTFPLMSTGLARAHRGSAGESLAMLYFTNSLGAAAGVLTSGFLLIDQFGLPGTLIAAGVINLVIALVVWVISRPARHPAIAPADDTDEQAIPVLLAVAFFTGLASFVYEISWIRMLSLVLGASTHSFEVMLATFIFGLAVGGLAMRRRVDTAAEPIRLLAWVQVVMGLAAAFTLPFYDSTFAMMEALLKGISRTDTGYLIFNLSGAGIAALVMLPATFCAGMTLPLITGALLRRGMGEAAIGQVYASNTLGAILGVLLAVHIGLPLIGLKATLLFGASVDVVLGLALLAHLELRKTAAWTAGAAAVLLVGLAAGVQLDPHKMTAGVFRHGDIGSSRDATILFNKDGKTATVHLVKYPEAVSLRTNGKSDGSINLDPAGERGTDEITMVLTAALPLALKPETKSAAVIGIGTGLTTHTLLQSLDIERVETVEIESAMAEASRGFMPRNSATFVDPRGTITIDDAKSFFSTHDRRYDLIISEPSNPWVSGVSGLFTREFYRRIRKHLNSGGLLVQWMQLYEMDASLVATVLGALGEEFPHYAVFAPSDYDLLIMAADTPIPLPPQAKVFEQPGVAKELWTVHVMTAGDMDARYLGNRALLEPLFKSYGMPANSDYAPVLDRNAARHRFTERSATDVLALLNAEIPLLEMLDPQRSKRPVNPLFKGAYAFERTENTRLAWYARDFLLSARPPVPEGVPRDLEKDLELVKLRLMECRDPRDMDIWLHSAIRVAKAINPYLAPDDARAVWDRVIGGGCYQSLLDYQRRWIGLFQAVATRNAPRMAEIAAALLGEQQQLVSDAREYLVLAALTGYIASGAKPKALELWGSYSPSVRVTRPAFRLLRCQADPVGCTKAFRVYAER